MSDFQDHNKLLSIKGTHQATIQPYTQVAIDYVADQTFLTTGCDYEAIGRNFGDTATFQVVVPGSFSVVGEFAKNIFVREKAYYEFYRANIPQGLIVRAIYNNVGPNVVNFNLNLVRHIDKAV